MTILRAPGAMRRLVMGWRRRRLSVGFVPTMGALHRGHLSLIRRARRENDRVVTSIFVNPLQFGPGEDYLRYPRPLSRDRSLCRGAGVDALYLPAAAVMVPDGFRTTVEVRELSDRLCGAFRPGHFRGVATAVLKLLNAVMPDRAYFGEKDFQQWVILGRMVRDLDMPVSIVSCPTVREEDGLALSSRNVYLDPRERAWAAALNRTLRFGAELARRPGARRRAVEGRMRRELLKLRDTAVDYAAVVDASTLEPPQKLEGKLRIAAAVRIGRTRLIDNIPLDLGKSPGKRRARPPARGGGGASP